MMPAGSARAPWQAVIEAALEANRSQMHSRFVQLATLRENGRPANRTVVFRGWRKANDRELIFVTNRRSDKMREIAKCAWSEVCWYFTETREQFRITGTLRAVAEGDAELAQERADAWRAVSEATRAQFLWPDPGAPIAADAPWAPLPGALDPVVPAADFVLLVLTPTAVDHLTLEPPRRTLHAPADPVDPRGPWLAQRVARAQRMMCTPAVALALCAAAPPRSHSLSVIVYNWHQEKPKAARLLVGQLEGATIYRCSWNLTILG